MNRWFVRIVQIIFGLWYLLNGLNFFFQFYDIPRPTNPVAGVLMQGFVSSHMFTYVKDIEVVAGVATLIDLFVPLVLVLSFPISVIIGYIDVVILGSEMNSWVFGGGLFAAHVILLFAYLPYYRSMFVARTGLFSRARPA